MKQVPKVDSLDYEDLAKPLFTVKVSKTNANSAIRMFLASGQSNHTRYASCLGAIIRYCEQNKIAYTLKSRPSLGYSIEIDKNPDTSLWTKDESWDQQ